jgi:hypothetical protein
MCFLMDKNQDTVMFSVLVFQYIINRHPIFLEDFMKHYRG